MGHVRKVNREIRTWSRGLRRACAYLQHLNIADYTRLLTETEKQFIRRYTPMRWMLLLRFEIDKGLVISKR